jgi:tRNA threonylcarbamoyladenosine biosynthesis protein TsaE
VNGELGSGKTTLVRGLLRALGIKGAVKSPTYTWVEPYTLSRLDLYHFDFYRLENRTEWLSSGLREYFRPDTVCIVEWPERAGDLLPAPDLFLRLTYGGEAAGEARQAAIDPRSPAGHDWLASLQHSLSS